jgi:two-component system response regulator HydG
MNPTRLLTGSSSPVFRAFLDTIETVATSDVTVLLSGEIGSGKTVIARLLHDRSERVAGPIVEVPISAMSPTLVESELFGHVKGAFTDARRERLGCFRRADGGTLVLESIDLMPLDVQVKLLRAIQERVVEPVGGEGPIPVDVRLVATSTADLAALVEAGTFREDLYYRLSVVPLVVPPLRTRLEDMDALVEILLGRLHERLQLAAPKPAAGKSFTPAAMERLLAHPWPGNVRELENSLERALVLDLAGRKKGVAREPIDAPAFDFLDDAVAGIAEELGSRALAHGLKIDDVTTAMMQAAMAEERGNVSAAARRLGITRRALEYRIDPEKGGASKPTKSASKSEDKA